MARPTAKYQYLYLNGRIIRDRFIQHALREAYRGLTEPGRHPAAILLLEIPPGDVDVNVHPTKIEVRFRDGGRIHGLIHSAVRERLLGSDLTPKAIPMNRVADPTENQDLRQKLASFFRGLPSGVVVPAPSNGNGGAQVPSAGENTSRADGFLLNPAPRRGARFEFMAPSQVAPPSEPAANRPLPVDAPAAAPANSSGASSAIQLHNSYLVAESEDGLVIIDQHALHERIMYEELLARLSRGPLESQRLLIPQVIETASTQLALLEQIQPLLARLGIEVSAFGPGSVAVHAFPTFLERLEPGDIRPRIAGARRTGTARPAR